MKLAERVPSRNGRPQYLLRSLNPPVSLRFDRRTIVVGVIVVALIVLVGAYTLTAGASHTPLSDVVSALLGQGDRRTEMVVVKWRLPRLLFAIFCGAALGMSGALFQSLTRNPLGSPDIIGFAAGSYTGALLVMLVAGSTGYYLVAAGSLIGGIVTAALVYLLAYRRGVEGFRLIIMGIGVSAVLGSVNSYLMLRAKLQDAMSAAAWGSGSLNGLSFDQFWPMLTILVLLVPMALALGPGMRQLEMGDDAAKALGLRTERLRLGVVVIGVALTALVTAAAGPISFIALAAPQIARRLTGVSGIGMIPAALTGALLLTCADVVANSIQLPVGIITVSIGGTYLLWLLVREYRRRK
ncbi:iron chelate uptake ABC transporter family permease subunit [Arthrobacter sp. GMC3]|uniref:FecCD family ABC transporter permease n=1 Tax=Arthrobacter sp. GMC3 TaxID=2058894 RepID=UPI000CE57A93|nr:iron chelate uptake ABC transporter family permease subunit [Arthrobacter sp. GMC3]